MRKKLFEFISLLTVTFVLSGSVGMNVFAGNSEEVLEVYPTCYETGEFSPVTATEKNIYANGTSLIFKDEMMYQDFEPYGEFGENDKRIFTEPYIEELQDSLIGGEYRYNGKNDMSLRVVTLFTGGENSTEYGDCRITIDNTTIKCVYVNHTANTVVNISNSNVTDHNIANATGNVDYTIDSNTGRIDNIYLLDDITESAIGKNAGFVAGNLNLTLNNVKYQRGQGAHILPSGTVLGDTRIVVNNSEVYSIAAAHKTGSDTKKGNVYVDITDSTISALTAMSGGYYGEQANINGNIEIKIKNSESKFGVMNYYDKDKVTGTAKVIVENSSIESIENNYEKNSAATIEENVQLIIKDSDVDKVISDVVNLEGTVTADIQANTLRVSNNATLFGDVTVDKLLEGRFTWQYYDDRIQINETAKIADGTKVNIVPLKKTNDGYVPYKRGEKLYKDARVYFFSRVNAIDYLKYFSCDCGILSTREMDMNFVPSSVIQVETYPDIEIPEKPNKIANVISGVHVYWNEVKGAEKYGLWRSENGKNGTYKWVANPTIPHFTDTNVQTGKTYYYKVTVLNTEYNIHSDKSEAIGVTYVSTPDITSRVNKAAGIQLGWNKIAGATGYAIYRKSYSGNEAWVRVGTISGNSTFSWTDTEVKSNNGIIYKYTVRALTGSDMKTLSGCRNAGRTMVRLSSRVLNSATKADATSIKCSWTTSAQVTGYEVRFMVGDKVYKTQTIGNYKTGSKTFTGLKKGQTYKVQVRAYKKVEGVGSFYSAWSTAKSVQL